MEIEQKPILEVRNLKQHFKVGSGKRKIVVKAVDDVSFYINKGETLGLVGESGCGKTTTGRSIINLYNITDGQVYFKNVKIAQGSDSFKNEIRSIRLKISNNISSLKSETKKIISTLKDEINTDIKLNHIDKIRLLKSESKENIDSIKAKEDLNKSQLIKEVKLNTLEKINVHKTEIKQKNKKVQLEVKSYKTKLANDISIAKSPEDYNRIKTLKQEIRNSKQLYNQNKDYYDKIQMIFQDPISSLNPRMTVKEIIAEGLRINGEKNEKVITEKVENILKIVGLLPEHSLRYPHEFSGGQRQRIGVARALVINPEVLIADEPISALDVSIQAQVINLLNDLKESLGLTVLFIAHDLSVVKYFSDRIAVMYYGKIVELAESKELFLNPLHPYTKSLLSAIPIPDPRVERKRKRETYTPSSHNYCEGNQPSLVEIKKGHFVYASPSELEEYKLILKQ